MAGAVVKVTGSHLLMLLRGACRGMWIFRGQDIPPIMKEECFDLDLYTWQKVDPSDPVRCFCYL